MRDEEIVVTNKVLTVTAVLQMLRGWTLVLVGCAALSFLETTHSGNPECVVRISYFTSKYCMSNSEAAKVVHISYFTCSRRPR